MQNLLNSSRAAHSLVTGAVQVKAEGRLCFLSAVCMGCLEGWNCRLQCRNGQCSKLWDGSQLILGTMYSYDIFAAVPCCADRLKVGARLDLSCHHHQVERCGCPFAPGCEQYLTLNLSFAFANIKCLRSTNIHFLCSVHLVRSACDPP